MFRLCVGTMVIRLARFNTYLLAAALGATLAGCGTAGSSRDKEVATLRLHVEVNRDAGDRSQPVMISRAAQIQLNVDKIQFLDEASVTEAKVMDTMGAFTMVIQFDRRGTLFLEQYSATNPGRHIAIAAQWGDKEKQTRWLAAPLINHRITDGILTFTPDATRAEAEEIARGVNNVAIKNGNQKKPKAKEKAKNP